MSQRWGRFLVVVAVWVIASVLLVSTAQAQYFGQNKVQYREYGWKSLTSDHFEV